MNDLAHVGLSADSKPIKEANADLDKMTEAAKRVEASVTGMGGAVEAAAQRVVRSITPAEEAMKKLEADVMGVTRASVEHGTVLQEQTEGTWKKMAEAVGTLNDQWGATVEVLPDVQSGMASTQTQMAGASISSQVLAAGLRGVGLAIKSLLVGTAVTAVLGALYWAFDALTSGSEASSEEIEQLHDEMRALGTMSKEAASDVETLRDKLNNLAPDELRDRLKAVADRLDEVRGRGSLWDMLGITDTRELRNLQTIEDRLYNISRAMEAGGADTTMVDQLAKLVDDYQDGRISAEEMRQKMDEIAAVDVDGRMDDFLAALRASIPEAQALVDTLKQLPRSLLDDAANDNVSGAWDPFNKESGTDKLRDAMTKGKGRRKRDFGDLEGDAEERIAQLKAEADALGMTTGAAEAYRFEQELIAEATRMGIELSPDQLDAIAGLAERYGEAALKAEGLRLEMENRGPFEEMRDELGNLDELWKAGAISAETYADATRKAMANAHAAVAGYASDALGLMGQLFEDNKAIAVANAIVSTYEGVAKSLAKYPMPFAAVMAGLHLALGMKQVSAIMSTNKKSRSASSTGGSTTSPPTLKEPPAAPEPSNNNPSRVAGGGNTHTIILQGEDFSRDRVVKFIEHVNSLQENGGPKFTVASQSKY